MAYWLYKSEPSVWSWDAQVAEGDKGTHWNGVRNHVAKQNLMAMKKGEQGFFYHSNEGKAVVGIVEVIKEYYPDHTDATGKFGMILVNNSRLSVQPVTDEEWAIVCRMGGL
jgi:predicted RNA-binding protein with PUA-like domain